MAWCSSEFRSPNADSPRRAAAGLPMARAMSPERASWASSRMTSASLRRHSAGASPRSRSAWAAVPPRNDAMPPRAMPTASALRRLAVALWAALAVSLLGWIAAGYPWPLCILAMLPLLAPLRGMVRGSRYTYAWATLFAVPYLMFALTELLVNPQAQWVAGASLLLVFAWFCAMVAFLRISRARRE